MKGLSLALAVILILLASPAYALVQVLRPNSCPPPPAFPHWFAICSPTGECAGYDPNAWRAVDETYSQGDDQSDRVSATENFQNDRTIRFGFTDMGGVPSVVVTDIRLKFGKVVFDVFDCSLPGGSDTYTLNADVYLGGVYLGSRSISCEDGDWCDGPTVYWNPLPFSNLWQSRENVDAMEVTLTAYGPCISGQNPLEVYQLEVEVTYFQPSGCRPPCELERASLAPSEGVGQAASPQQRTSWGRVKTIYR